jgi:hypothetical protein
MGFLRGVLAILAATVSLRDCGNPVTDQAVVTGFGFSPVNPVAGEPTELWVAYDLKSQITGGTATYSFTLNGLPFTPTVDDLCTQTVCPKDVGSYNETSKSTFPSGVSGKIVSKITWKNQNDEPVWCLESTFKI